MNVVYSEDLKAYMEKKGRSNLVLRTISPTGCCGGAPELIIDLAGEDSVNAWAEKPGMKIIETEVGKVAIEFTLIPEEDDATVTFGLKRFIGLPDITATGLRQLA